MAINKMPKESHINFMSSDNLGSHTKLVQNWRMINLLTHMRQFSETYVEHSQFVSYYKKYSDPIQQLYILIFII